MDFLKFMDFKYDFVGGKAFTEDKIIIYNIRICVVNEKLSIRQIKKYFRRFGHLQEVRFLGEGKNSCIEDILRLSGNDRSQEGKINYYIVKFSNPKAAARVLKTTMHRIKNCVIRVDACDSSDQPDGRKVIEEITKTFENNSLAQNADFPNDCKQPMIEQGILTLNDDCLENICKYLTLPDQINFALTCQRFCDIFTILSKVKHKNFRIEILEDMTQFQIRILLQIMGHQIITLTADFSFFEFNMEKEQETVMFLGLFLTNVENLKVIQNNHHSLNKLIEKMPKLQELELIRCRFEENFIKYLKKYENLRSLKIVGNPDIDGTEIQHLTGLDKLKIYHCEEIYPELKTIFKSLTNLTYLDLHCNTFDALLGTEDYESITNHLVQLTTLKITLNTGNFQCLAQLPRLKILEIKSYLENIFGLQNFFKNLAKFQANQLEELGILSDFVTAEVVDSIVKLKNLKVLKCNFVVDDENLEKFSQLVNLKNIVLHHTEFGDDGILKLLRNCLQLKRISLMCSIDEKSDLITRARKLLQEQRNRGHRVDCVYFGFIYTLFDPDKQLEKSKSSDILKIIEESEDENEYDDEYFGNCMDDDDDELYYDHSDEDFYNYFDYNDGSCSEDDYFW